MTSSLLALSPITFPLPPKELDRWIRFAMRGGIGKGDSLVDVEGGEDGGLMFFRGEEVIFLRRLLAEDDLYLGYCEGVVGRFNAKDVTLTTKLKNVVLSPRNTILPNPPPPYDQKSTPSSALPITLPVDSLAEKDGRDGNGSEISSCQIYYDASEDSVKRFRDSRNSVQTNLGFTIITSDSDQDNVREEKLLGSPLSSSYSDATASRPLKSPTPSSRSVLDAPSLLSSPSSDLDRDLPTTPPSIWTGTDLPESSELLDLEESFANSFSYYHSISPEPHDRFSSESENTSPFHSSGSNYSRTTHSDLLSSHELLNSHFSDISLSDILNPYTSATSSKNPTATKEIAVHSEFSSPSDTTSPNLSRQSRLLHALESRWSKCTYEEHEDDTEMLIFNLYGSPSRDSLSSSINKLKMNPLQSTPEKFRLIEKLGYSADSSSPHSERSSDKNLLDRLRRGSIPGSPSIDSLIGGIALSESNDSIFSDLSNSSSDWHNSSGIITSATLFHQPYFSPVLLRKQASKTTDDYSDLNTSPTKQSRLLFESAHASPTTPKINLNDSNSQQNTPVAPTSTTIPKLSLRTTFNIPKPQKMKNGLSPMTTRDSPRARQSPSSYSFTSPISYSSLPASDSTYSLASPNTQAARKFSAARPSFKTGDLARLIGPPRTFSCSTNIDSITSSGYETPPLSSSRSRDFSESSASPLSPSSSYGRNSMMSVGILTRFTSNHRKTTVLGRPRVDYGFPVGSKDLEEETIELRNVEFEMIKPLVKLFNLDNEPESIKVSKSPDQTLFSPLPIKTSSEQERHLNGQPISPTIQLRSLANNRYAVVEETSIEEYRAKELKWIQAISSGSTLNWVQSSKKMNILVQKGIPSSVRTRVYQFLSEAVKATNLYPMLSGLEEPKGFNRYDQDLAQTFLDHPLLGSNSRARTDMRLIVKSICLWDSRIGYFKGMTSIVAYFLTFAPAQETFDLLVALIKNGTLRQYVENGGLELKVNCVAFDFLLGMIDPELSKRLSYIGVESIQFLPAWISSLFITTLPYSTMIQVVDLILFDQNYSIKVALAILQLNRARLLDTHLSPDRFSIIKYLNNIPETAISATILLPTAFSLKIDSKIKKALKKAEAVVLGGIRK